MIQITKWINVNEGIWYRGNLIPAFDWLTKEKVRLEKLTQKKCEIRTDKGHIALFRERLK
jgi:hypothetical protein